MAKIKVASNQPPYNGMAITFDAPCACNAVDGLTVSYGGASQNFTFRDAHGNDLTGLGNLFLAGAYVSVTLDTVNGYAYLKNADTNAYLEGRFAECASPSWSAVQNKPAMVAELEVSGSTLSVTDTEGNVTDLTLPSGGGTTDGILREFDSGAISNDSYTYNGINSKMYFVTLKVTDQGDRTFYYTTSIAYRAIRYLNNCVLEWVVPCPNISAGSYITLRATVVRTGTKSITFTVVDYNASYISSVKIVYVEGFN